jgi:hypothetical protein
MAVREYLGQDAYEAMLVQFAEQIADKGLPHVWKQGDTERGAYLVQYRKAPLLLARLEKEVGNDVFLHWLQMFFANRGSTTPELLETLQSVAGEGAREQFEAMLAE